MNILHEANQIVNYRTQEKERMYGNFEQSMDKMAEIFNSLTGLKLTAIEMYKAMIALKLSREHFHHKEDNLLDAVAYMGAMNNHLNKLNNEKLQHN